MLTDDCMLFLLEVMGFQLDESDHLWFFSDWFNVTPRTFEERLHDYCVSRLSFRLLPPRP